MSRILIVDIERSVRNVLGDVLTNEGHTCLKATNVEEACGIINEQKFDLVMCEMASDSASSVKMLKNIVENHPETYVIMESGCGDIETAVACIKLGAVDFLQKPLELNRVLTSVRSILDTQNVELVKENKRLRKKLSRSIESAMVGNSSGIQNVQKLIEKISSTSARVLITGDNGTGKELAARLIHTKSSRASYPFIAVNCAAIPSELIESELFGHEKGSFTGAIKQRKGKFEQAEGGTIFLDEIGDMSLSAQAKVLRALQENKITRVGSDADILVDVRVIAATNKDLIEEICAGRFREDLYHRLSVIRLHIPALSERRDDIPLLVDYFLKAICDEQSRAMATVEPEALEILQSMPWTGNIRELRNCVERLVILSADPMTITAKDVKLYC